MSDEEYVDINGAAHQLGVTPITIRRYLGIRQEPGRNTDPIMAFRRTPGKRIRIAQSEIDRIKKEYAR